MNRLVTSAVLILAFVALCGVLRQMSLMDVDERWMMSAGSASRRNFGFGDFVGSKMDTYIAPPQDEERFFQAFGSGAAVFAMYGAYRGGSNTFAVVGLGSRALYTFGDPQFECYWVPSWAARTHPNERRVEDVMHIKSAEAYRMLPDMDYGRVYSVVVVNCTFAEPVGTAADDRGGQLVLYATHGDGSDKPPERIVALTEDELSYDPANYEAPYRYDFVYCGAPLYGDLNPERIREWMSYHVRLLGRNSHFIFHDAGGISAEVRAVLEPWQNLGYVTVQNVTQQEDYDGYYHNQFLIYNDCLHRTRFLANWTFFFDVDEYIYVSPDTTFTSFMAASANLTMLQLYQVRMSNSLCSQPTPHNNSTTTDSRWAFEKLVYVDKIPEYEKTAPKYAVQGRDVFATGVHRSQVELGHMQGQEGFAWWQKMRYYHYRDTLSVDQQQICSVLLDNTTTSFTFHENTFQLDTSMVYMGPLVKQYELEHIGNRWG